MGKKKPECFMCGATASILTQYNEWVCIDNGCFLKLKQRVEGFLNETR